MTMTAALPARLANQVNWLPLDAVGKHLCAIGFGWSGAIGDTKWLPQAGWLLMPRENALPLAVKKRATVTIATTTWRPRMSLWRRPTWRP
jgi:hypothetical protein